MIRFVSVNALVSLVLVMPSVLAHGVRHSVSEGATVVTATYEDGSPMAFCDVTVFAPGSRQEPYQEGTSDRNGCFAFLPDTNGTWRVTVNDGMGHLADAVIKIGSAGRRDVHKAHHADRLGGAMVGIGVIFGCFGIYAMLAGRIHRWKKGKETGA